MEHHITFPSSYHPMLSPGKREARIERTPYSYIKETTTSIFSNLYKAGKTIIGAASHALTNCRNGSKSEKTTKRKSIFQTNDDTPVPHSQMPSQFIIRSIQRDIYSTQSCNIKRPKTDDTNSPKSVSIYSIRPSRLSEVKNTANVQFTSQSSPIKTFKSREIDTPSFKTSLEDRSADNAQTHGKNEISQLPEMNDFFHSLEKSLSESMTSSKTASLKKKIIQPKQHITLEKSQLISKQEVRDLLDDATSKLLKEMKDSHEQLKTELISSRQEILKSSAIIYEKVPKLEVTQHITPTFKKYSEPEMVAPIKKEAMPSEVHHAPIIEKQADIIKPTLFPQTNLIAKSEELPKKDSEPSGPCKKLFADQTNPTNFATMNSTASPMISTPTLQNTSLFSNPTNNTSLFGAPKPNDEAKPIVSIFGPNSLDAMKKAEPAKPQEQPIIAIESNESTKKPFPLFPSDNLFGANSNPIKQLGSTSESKPMSMQDTDHPMQLAPTNAFSLFSNSNGNDVKPFFGAKQDATWLSPNLTKANENTSLFGQILTQNPLPNLGFNGAPSLFPSIGNATFSMGKSSKKK